MLEGRHLLPSLWLKAPQVCPQRWVQSKLPPNQPLAETGMLLPGKYSEGKKKQREKYEVRANLKDFVPEEENTDK